uniref:Uncharacterized protein n=1 Tax=Anguilla anguilla TaxID=7936 RepID=A0A0E9TLH5_ANGAN
MPFCLLFEKDNRVKV